MSEAGDDSWLNLPQAKDVVAAPTVPEISTHDTIVPRYLAASMDNVLSFIASIAAAKAIPEEWAALQVTVFIAVFPMYFFVQEGLFSRTIGKFFTGLMVVQYDGKRCTWRQAAIRTAFRFLEVNPILFGALPAALSIIFSQHRQRFGDKVAQTIVVPARRVS